MAEKIVASATPSSSNHDTPFQSAESTPHLKSPLSLQEKESSGVKKVDGWVSADGESFCIDIDISAAKNTTIDAHPTVNVLSVQRQLHSRLPRRWRQYRKESLLGQLLVDLHKELATACGTDRELMHRLILEIASDEYNDGYGSGGAVGVSASDTSFLDNGDGKQDIQTTSEKGGFFVFDGGVDSNGNRLQIPTKRVDERRLLKLERFIANRIKLLETERMKRKRKHSLSSIIESSPKKSHPDPISKTSNQSKETIASPTLKENKTPSKSSPITTPANLTVSPEDTIPLSKLTKTHNKICTPPGKAPTTGPTTSPSAKNEKPQLKLTEPASSGISGEVKGVDELMEQLRVEKRKQYEVWMKKKAAISSPTATSGKQKPSPSEKGPSSEAPGDKKVKKKLSTASTASSSMKPSVTTKDTVSVAIDAVIQSATCATAAQTTTEKHVTPLPSHSPVKSSTSTPVSGQDSTALKSTHAESASSPKTPSTLLPRAVQEALRQIDHIITTPNSIVKPRTYIRQMDAALLRLEESVGRKRSPLGSTAMMKAASQLGINIKQLNKRLANARYRRAAAADAARTAGQLASPSSKVTSTNPTSTSSPVVKLPVGPSTGGPPEVSRVTQPTAQGPVRHDKPSIAHQPQQKTNSTYTTSSSKALPSQPNLAHKRPAHQGEQHQPQQPQQQRPGQGHPKPKLQQYHGFSSNALSAHASTSASSVPVQPKTEAMTPTATLTASDADHVMPVSQAMESCWTNSQEAEHLVALIQQMIQR